MPEPCSVRIYVWACACKVWGGTDDDECETCGESPCHHFYSRECARMCKSECWDGKARCDECGEPPIIRGFSEVRDA